VRDAWASTRSWPTFLVWLCIAIGLNVLALIVVNWIFDSVAIEGFWSYFLAGLTLGLGNAFLKPILALLTLPLIILTFGLAYFALNILMLALAEWIAPHFSIDGFWTYVGAVIVIWFVNVLVGALLDWIAGGATSAVGR
jgi:putative membrane protein